MRLLKLRHSTVENLCDVHTELRLNLPDENKYPKYEQNLGTLREYAKEGKRKGREI